MLPDVFAVTVVAPPPKPPKGDAADVCPPKMPVDVAGLAAFAKMEAPLGSAALTCPPNMPVGAVGEVGVPVVAPPKMEDGFESAGAPNEEKMFAPGK